jgi:hypothetical protein
MKPREKLFDPACFEIAALFLGDEPELRGRENELAACIQQAIEDWIESEKCDQRNLSAE